MAYYWRIVDTTMLFLVTPISENESELRFIFYYEEADNDQAKRKLIEDFVQQKFGVRENLSDIPIWEKKIYRERPLLCDGDGPIMKFRSWFKQFYDIS